MKAVKIIFGLLAAAVTIGYLVQFIGVLTSADSSTRGIAQLASAFAVLCVGAAISVSLLQSAFRKSSHRIRR